MQLFHRAPRGVANAPAVHFGRDKQKIEIAPLTVHPDNDAADRLTVLYDSIGFAAINGFLDGLTGDDLAIFLKVIISKTEFLQCAIVERFLIVPDKLLTII